ncbi:alpha/beta hydrolase [Chryseolinea sp. T2]|uniref:alpha/beta fold hydrolase n=1 Tax=Chryseolinea sp. T2 TaxID=3129255 RepID=UPI0030770724
MDCQIFNRNVTVDGIDIFYREARDRSNPSLLLLHGFPTSSVMFRSLMISLSDSIHVVAPDYPGFGFSSFPSINTFDYSFENLSVCMNRFTEAIGLKTFSVYLHDYGCPIGLRMAVRNPERIERLIIQNGNAYIEGIGPQWDETRDYWERPTDEKKIKVAAFLSADGVAAQYTEGLPREMLDRISPELRILDWERMSRPGNVDMQFALNCTFKSNLEMYPAFQEYFRRHQRPALIIWGRHDAFFDVAEAYCYQRDLPNAGVHILEGGHMALETNFSEVLELVRGFMLRLPT